MLNANRMHERGICHRRNERNAPNRIGAAGGEA